MKKLLLLFAFVPVLLFGGVKHELCFEANAGQVQVKNPADGAARFVLRGKVLSYLFFDWGYSVLQRNENGRQNRVDFRFRDGGSYRPETAGESNGRVNVIGPGGTIVAPSYTTIVYKNCVEGCDVEFSVAEEGIRKKLVTHNGIFPKTFGFITSGAIAKSYPICAPVCGSVFKSPAGSIVETLDVETPDQDYWPALYMNENYPAYRIVHPNVTASIASISWYTYVGGTSADEFFGTALMPAEGGVVVGRTASIDFPSTAGSMQDTIAGSYDVVVMRFDSVGNCLWSTFYGGTNFDSGYGVLRINGRIVVAGSSNSNDLPVQNAWQDSTAGSYDAFLLTLDDSGMMVRATYFGGPGADQAFALAVDTSGRITVAGSSTANGLPLASGGYQPTVTGAIDAFLAVFDTLLQPQWSTYYGGTSSEDIHSVTVTPQGEIVFCGGTFSTNFPVTPDAYQPGLLSVPDVYVVKFGMDGTRHYATFFGGTNQEDANSITCDSLGNVYFAGFTFSIDFPLEGNSFQTTHGAMSDAFVACLDSTGQLVWSTLLGGNGTESAFSIYRQGKYIYIGGNTESTDFPVSANAIQATNGGLSDGFVIKMDTTGDMVCGTYMGGNGVDAIYGIVVTPADTSVIACADTYSTNLPVTPGAYQNVNNGSGDGYVVKFGMSEQPVPDAMPEELSEGTFTVYPQPATNELNILGKNEIVSATIVDNTGRVVLGKTMIRSVFCRMPVARLAPGIYYVQIEDASGAVTVVPFVRQ